MLAKAKHTVPAYQREMVPFLGLNRSDDTREGEFSEQKNMSDRRYPFLAPRLPRSQQSFEKPEAMFAWDGTQIIAEKGKLLYDGEVLCDVDSGKKQFAVVNTKLVVWPDRLIVDLVNKKAERMVQQVVNNGTCTIAGNNQLLFEERTATETRTLGYYGKTCTTWTYGAVSFDPETGEWTVEDTQISSVLSTGTKGRYYIPNTTVSSLTGVRTDTAPNTVFNGTPDQTFNELGIYGQFADFSGYYGTAAGTDITWTLHIYDAANDNKTDLTKMFRVGDFVTISGADAYSKENAEVKAVGSDRLTFADNTFPRTATHTFVEASKLFHGVEIDGTHYLVRSGSITGYKNQVVSFFEETGTLSLNGETYETTVNYDSSYTYISMSYANTRTETAELTVTREVPELDYICEHENRLWGVSTKDKTIYASALGDPCNFFDYSGDAGGYAVAVGSEGGFTGICSYGNAVLCWKERTLHKVLGDVPSNYQTAVYRFAGVRDGAHKSLVNVNEMLFFLGVDGVYAYTGNKPALISRALGADVLKDGVGGTDGRAYYLSARNGNGWELLAYDTHTGLWTRSDETRVVDFCRIDDKVKFLSGNAVYTIGEGDEQVEWEAVFVPMYETLEGGKQYNRLIFRVEVPKGGWLAADVRFDAGRWTQVGIVKEKTGSVHMPVPLRRCDKFQIRLRGKGDCAVLEMAREFRLRGDG